MYFDKRCAGVLLPLFSLPDSHGDGDLGHNAYRFIEFLQACGFSLWQLLPVGPVHADRSPYLSLSAHAGNPELISFDWLRDRGWLDANNQQLSRSDLLWKAYQGFEDKATDVERNAFQEFVQRSGHWLQDYVLFIVIRMQHHNTAWCEWPFSLRDRHPDSLQKFADEFVELLECQRFIQWIFFQQWHELKQYAHKHAVRLFGDMPLFVSFDSADVWAHRDLFLLDEQGRPTVVAGTPPDYFAEEGQRWGNPLYRWERMRADGFQWWKRRLATQLVLYDAVRIDHFRGLQAYWEIPADASTAIDGHWVKAPGRELLSVLYEEHSRLPVIAEDLGTITAEVDELRQQFSIPGMRVLQFGFDGDPFNPHAPHNFIHDCVVYTGTHDNNTTLGWYQALPEHERDNVANYSGHPQESMPWPLIKSACSSVARWAIVPMQDILQLGSEARVNTPGTIEGNWSWRFAWEQVEPGLAQHLRAMLYLYRRV